MSTQGLTMQLTGNSTTGMALHSLDADTKPLHQKTLSKEEGGFNLLDEMRSLAENRKEAKGNKRKMEARTHPAEVEKKPLSRLGEECQKAEPVKTGSLLGRSREGLSRAGEAFSRQAAKALDGVKSCGAGLRNGAEIAGRFAGRACAVLAFVPAAVDGYESAKSAVEGVSLKMQGKGEESGLAFERAGVYGKAAAVRAGGAAAGIGVMAAGAGTGVGTLAGIGGAMAIGEVTNSVADGIKNEGLSSLRARTERLHQKTQGQPRSLLVAPSVPRQDQGLEMLRQAAA